METINIPIGDIAHYQGNPRKNDQAVNVVAKSIKEFGFLVPVILDDKNTIVAGHTRVKAAAQLGMTEVPVVYAEGLTDEQIKAFRIMDNKSHEYSWWDTDLLKQELEELKDLGVDLSTTGFLDRELNELIKMDEDKEFDVDKAVEEAQKEEPYVKTGDIWQLGEHKLIIGNSVDQENWEKLLGEEKFDFMFTDPPYKLAYTKNRFKGKVKTNKGFGFKGQRHYLGVERAGGVPEFDEWLSIANNFQNPNGANVMVFEYWKNTPKIWKAIEKYWKIQNMVIWHVPGRTQGFGRKHFLFNKYDISILADSKNKEVNDIEEEEYTKFLEEKGEKLVNNIEVALYGKEGKATFNRQKRKATAKVSDHISWSPDNEKQSGQNLVFGTKPLPILIPYIKVLSNPEEIIMEPFGGAGSTLISCEILGRKCRAIEIEPLYAQVIIKRWEKLTGKKASKVDKVDKNG